jgi:hypothetical protein
MRSALVLPAADIRSSALSPCADEIAIAREIASTSAATRVPIPAAKLAARRVAAIASRDASA